MAGTFESEGELIADPWSKVLADFTEAAEKHGVTNLEGIILLLKGIINSPYAEHIHGKFSIGCELYISQTPQFKRLINVLMICSNKTGGIDLEWRPRGWKTIAPDNAEWRRTYAAAEAFAGFEKFIKLQKWFI